jgi:hypothetical protein
MSNVKLCDGEECGAIFPEGIEGSSVGSHFDPESGRNVADDWCPDCTAKRKAVRQGQVWRRGSNQPAKEIEP